MFLTDIISTLVTRSQAHILTSSPSLVLSDRQTFIQIATSTLMVSYREIQIFDDVFDANVWKKKNGNYFIWVVTIKYKVIREGQGKTSFDFYLFYLLVSLNCRQCQMLRSNKQVATNFINYYHEPFHEIFILDMILIYWSTYYRYLTSQFCLSNSLWNKILLE